MPPTPPRPGRRGRHASGITLAASALSAFALVAACAGPPQPSGPGGQDAYTLSADTPAAKGQLDSFSWALYAEPPTLDYLQAFDYPQNTVLSNICESLMRWTPQLKEEPGLAERATNPDPTTWVFDLRPGVKFQDGTVMTADDVVFSLDRQRNPDNGGAWANEFQNVDTIARTGPLQVTIKLKTPDSQFPQYMATAAGVVASARGVQAAGKDYGTSGSLDCTGPYRLGSWTKGQSIELDRFDDYWGARAKSKKVVFEFLTDPSARTNALLTGEADGGYLIPTESYARLKNSSAGTLYFGESLSTVNVNVTNTHGPLGDVRVRKALSLAIDRAGFVSTGLGGNGTATTSLTSKAAWAAADAATQQAALGGLQPTAQDIAQATQLIKDAGARGKTLTMATSSIGQDVSLLATAVQSAGTRIGLDIQLRTIAPDAFTALFTDPKAREGIDMFPETYYLSITDPMDLLTNFQTGSYQNYAGYSDKAYDDLVKQAVGTYDPAQRLAIEARLNQQAADQALWIPVAQWPTSLFMNKRITGAPTTISYMYYPWAADVGAAR
ncbi:peptide/nickel transport system substrate-binding protein [Kitasatospora sp. GAS204A]|uniref:ABC transporter substrate-binding protein n=1 Tax=unclassified Kitasatospora TaxID=2633591 RepID=UPI002474B02E|nr:ABC transporter substrate-binding protein [Kitasatospora sp. GAS204B]MDH6120875.1 peptide/nickel transport system substrate-binding protein [Kitasatospora sp. GAS204B]